MLLWLFVLVNLSFGFGWCSPVVFACVVLFVLYCIASVLLGCLLYGGCCHCFGFDLER